MKTTKEQRYGLSLLCATEKAKGVYPALADTCKFMLDILADIETLEQRIAAEQSQSDRNGIDYMHEREAHDTTKAELAALKSLASKNSAEMRDLLEEFGRVKRERDALRKLLKREYVVQSQVAALDLAAVKKSLATAELERDRWKAVHDRGWKGWRGQDHGYVSDREGFDIASGPTLKAALDAAFALFPLKGKNVNS